MNSVKHLGAILMILGFLTALFGCAEDPAKHGDWTTFTMHRTSSVVTDSYHFTVTKTDSGMTVTGFCYVDDREFRVDGTYLSAGTEFLLRQADLASRPTHKSKKSTAVDMAQNTETVMHADGQERIVSLSSEERVKLTAALMEDVKSAAESMTHGAWTQLYLDFSSDNYSEGYSFEVLRSDGVWIAKGTCSVYDEANGGYCAYASEDGFVLDAATAEAIDALGLERYPATRAIEPDGDLAEILDGSVGGLTLGFADGARLKKATPASVDDLIADLLKAEFAKKAALQ